MEDVVLKHSYLQLNRILTKEPQMIHQKTQTKSPVSFSPQYMKKPSSVISLLPGG